ncbi:MAG TPA: hypothetical protein VFR33_15350 [Candidatus Dormibacteraeota bacterium]|nr:hypothetical protein [Candidatus Dormibacteraeota bacterium]
MEISDSDLSLIIEALEAASMWHDARSRVIDTAARRSARRYPGRAVDPGAGREADREKAKEYAELAARLKKAHSE